MSETNMGVTVREKIPGTGIWWVFIVLNKWRRSQKVGKKSEADYVARCVRREIAKGAYHKLPEAGAEENLTLKEYFQTFTRTYLVSAVRARTREAYTYAFDGFIIPAFGSKPLKEIGRKHVKGLLASLIEKNLSKGTIRIIIASLCAVFNHAKEDGLVVVNPAERMTKFYKEAKVKHDEILPLSKEDIPTFLEEVLKRSPEYYEIFLCAIHTGLRPGELVALRWSDVDFVNRFILVRKNVSKGKMGKTKTSRIRKVDMSDFLSDALKDFKVRQTNKFAAEGKPLPDWTFCNREGGRLDMHNLVNRHFHKCLDSAELTRRRFYDLRHTFASILAEAGKPLTYIQQQMGHSSITITANTYIHLMPGANREAVNCIPGLPIKGKNIKRFKK